MYILANLLEGPTAIAISAIVASGLTIIVQHTIAASKHKTLKQQLKAKEDEALREAENILKVAKLDAAAELLKKRDEANEEFSQTRRELKDQEKRLSRREDANQRQTDQLVTKEKTLQSLENDITER
jgi:ribonucrease Y